MFGASTTERVPPDVLRELGLGRVRTLVGEDQLAVGVVEGGRRPRASPAKDASDGRVAVIEMRDGTDSSFKNLAASERLSWEFTPRNCIE